MLLLLFSLLALFIGALLPLLLNRNPEWATRAGQAGAAGGGVLALAPAFRSLHSAQEISIRWPWAVPGGSFYLGIDALSGYFLIPIALLSALGAIYGGEYLLAHRGTRKPGPPWFFYNLLTASMILVVIARNAVLFLTAWEAMAVTSFFLVTYDHEKPNVQAAGWLYLVATHLGTAFLFALFAVLERESGSLDFDRFAALGALPPALASALFIFAVIGFGAKAGFVPFHIWLPEAHPAAPSHVSALMSGVMIKTGIYGLVRTLTFLDAPAVWWAWVLIALGVICTAYGVLFALVQHDLKRLLAYHSVENIGIIVLGLGVGLWGVCMHQPAVALLGYAGGLLHVLNHALFKGLLFLGAGNVLHATGSGNLDGLGGLLKRMPRTGGCFLIGAAAICGLPPLNGFVSEFLVFLASFQGVSAEHLPAVTPILGGIAGLALISGLAAACFSKVFGMVFLGEPRSNAAAEAHEVRGAMIAPLVLLAALCIAIGLAGPWVFRAILPVTAPLVNASSEELAASVQFGQNTLFHVTLGAGFFFMLFAGLAFARKTLLAGRAIGETGTWDCGYAAPNARMQYTASSYAQPLAEVFHAVLRTTRHYQPPEGLFPCSGALETHTPDWWHERAYRPLAAWLVRGMAWFRRLQPGHVQWHVLYIAITLLLLLVWKIG